MNNKINNKNYVNSLIDKKNNLYNEKISLEVQINDIEYKISKLQHNIYYECKNSGGHDFEFVPPSGMYEKSSNICKICDFEQ
jgi:hypothetical protein